MAAALQMYVDHGATPTNTVVDALGPPNVRYKTADDATIDENNPIPIPSVASTIRSFWKSKYLKVQTAPSTKVDNLRWYSDGTIWGTGITLKVAEQFPTNNSGAPASQYDQATGTVGADGDVITTHANITSAVDAAGKTSGAPLTVSVSETGAKMTAIGHMSNYLVTQLEVDETATGADLSNSVFTWKWDEI